MKRIRIGDDVYVKDPQRIISDCVSITGDVIGLAGELFTVDAYVAKMGGGYPIKLQFTAEQIGLRTGTPISKLSGRPGHPGYSEFCRIAKSWGYE